MGSDVFVRSSYTCSIASFTSWDKNNIAQKGGQGEVGHLSIRCSGSRLVT